jgi:hypothetical protein
MSDQESLDEDGRAMHASETLLDFLSYAGPAKAVVRMLLEGGLVLEGLVRLSTDRSTVRVAEHQRRSAAAPLRAGGAHPVGPVQP